MPLTAGGSALASQTLGFRDPLRLPCVYSEANFHERAARTTLDALAWCGVHLGTICREKSVMSQAAVRPGSRDDITTVIAIAAMAACTSDFAHEAIGHGSACLISGAHVTVLNNAFFQCSHFGRFVAMSGPLGNLAAGLIAFLAQSVIPARWPGWRLYALLVMSFSLFWEAGYLIQAMIKGSGDSVFAWRELVGPETMSVRGIAVAIGLSSYFLFSQMLALRAASFASEPGRVRRLLRPAWLTGIVAMVFSAAFYDPDRLGAMRDAGLSVAASFPLLFTNPRQQPTNEPASRIARDDRVISLGGLVLVLFVATMGRGIH